MSRISKVWLILLLIAITVVPIIVVIWTVHPSSSWVTVIALFPVLSGAIVSWWRYLYNFSPVVRDWYIKLRTHLGNQSVRVSVFARYAAPDVIGADEVIGIIRNQYMSSVEEVRTGTLSGSGSTVVYMPGWQGRFEFHVPLEEEYFEPGDEVRRLTFTMPDTTMSLRNGLRHLTTSVIPLIDSLAIDLPLNLETIALTLRFEAGRNPFLASYLQNVNPKVITSFECKLEQSPDTYLEIRKDSVMIVAPRVGIFSSLTQQYLGLSYLFTQRY